jgi:hypothetical protein
MHDAHTGEGFRTERESDAIYEMDERRFVVEDVAVRKMALIPEPGDRHVGSLVAILDRPVEGGCPEHGEKDYGKCNGGETGTGARCR